MKHFLEFWNYFFFLISMYVFFSSCRWLFTHIYTFRTYYTIYIHNTYYIVHKFNKIEKLIMKLLCFCSPVDSWIFLSSVHSTAFFEEELRKIVILSKKNEWISFKYLISAVLSYLFWIRYFWVVIDPSDSDLQILFCQYLTILNFKSNDKNTDSRFYGHELFCSWAYIGLKTFLTSIMKQLGFFWP